MPLFAAQQFEFTNLLEEVVNNFSKKVIDRNSLVDYHLVHSDFRADRWKSNILKHTNQNAIQIPLFSLDRRLDE
jgi:hypothetical protein